MFRIIIPLILAVSMPAISRAEPTTMTVSITTQGPAVPISEGGTYITQTIDGVVNY